jgi:hypothetical protein
MPTTESEIFAFESLLWELMQHRRRLLRVDEYEVEDNYKVSEWKLRRVVLSQRNRSPAKNLKHDII